MPPPRKLEGIVWPPGPKGDRSTTAANKDIWAASAAELDEKLQQNIVKEKNWRYGYQKHIISHVKKSLEDKDGCLKAAQSGLRRLHDTFEFIRGDDTCTLAEAMDKYKDSFCTGMVKGEGKKPSGGFSVPYKGRELKGDALVAQVNKWAKYGTIEQDTADAIAMVAKNDKWCDLSDSYFVLLGAGSAMGPFLVLMALGANVIAIDLDRPQIWKRLITIARNSCGTLTFPMKKEQSDCRDDDDLFNNSGSNLITQAPEIRNWLLDVHSGKALTVGCYVYLDGALHVQVALACDVIMQGLCEKRKNVVLAFLCTPTDAHVIPTEARAAALKEYSAMNLRNLLVMPFRLLPSNMLVKNVQPLVKAKDGNTLAFVDGLVVPQGPNYTLAKRMQHWRAIVSRSQGVPVSTHIAPSTATASVVHNRQFAWAYDGMPYFVPIEIFEQETSNAVMSALLVHDIRNKKAAAHPALQLSNPLELFKHCGFHGGVWRSAYTVGSIGEVSVLIHFIKVGKLAILGILALLVVLFAFYFR